MRLRRFLIALLAAGLAAVALPVARSTVERVPVIVRGTTGSALSPATIASHGGRVTARLDIIGGFAADVPADAIPRLAALPGVAAVTPDTEVRLHSLAPGADPGSMPTIAANTGADTYRVAGITGDGVDVALIDSGVVGVAGLDTDGKVVNGPDLSFDSPSKQLRHLDAFGHGTHMAGIIAGDGESFGGIAPGARIVNVKVAASDGATDVSQVIAAIDWVVQFRRTNGLNIRVLNLSFGTDGNQDYRLDPLAYAAEVAWHSGIVVVVAAGNAGFGDRALNDPAYDPYLLAVGASDHRGTADPSDDGVAAFSSIGTDRGPDLVAPGRSVLSLRAPASYLDVTYPDARVGDALFRGSGTSQAAAVVSGAAALLIAQRPDSTPDGIKAVLRGTARPLDGDPAGQGAGALDLAAAYAAPTPDAVQTWDRAAGSGSIDLARGSVRLSRDGVVLDGERDIFGTTFDASSWSGKARARSGWGEGRWNGNSWSGQGWTGNSWSGQLTGGSWFGNSWSGAWFGNSWSCAWSGNSWSGVWSGNSWSGELMGSSWSTAAWGN